MRSHHFADLKLCRTQFEADLFLALESGFEVATIKRSYAPLNIQLSKSHFHLLFSGSVCILPIKRRTDPTATTTTELHFSPADVCSPAGGYRFRGDRWSADGWSSAHGCMSAADCRSAGCCRSADGFSSADGRHSSV